MSEAGSASIGQALRDAREAQGISLDDAAVRLRLMQRQIEAMERDDFESLGQPVFARGFVRNYARLLGLAPEPLLGRMEGAPAEPPAVSRVEPIPSRPWFASPWLIVSLLALVLAVAVPVALYMWLSSEPEEPARTAAPLARHPAEGAPATPGAAKPEAAAPATTAASLPAAPPVVGDGQGESGDPASPAPVATESAPAGSVLHLEFVGDSWTEVRDESGRMLMRQLNHAGGSADVRGQPPFDLVIGNAAQVQLTYNGRAIDLKPFVDGTVARFTLEE